MNYSIWLRKQVCNEEEIQPYWCLFDVLYAFEFYWLLPLDESRAIDGKKMRVRYELDTKNDCDIDGPCRLLEMLLALSIRVRQDVLVGTEYDIHDVFWLILKYIGIDDATNYEYNENYIYSSIEEFLEDDSNTIWSKVQLLVWNEYQGHILETDY